MRAFMAPMQQLGEFEEIGRKLGANRGMLQVTGCIDSQKSHFMYCAGQQFQEITGRAYARAAGTAGPGWRTGTGSGTAASISGRTAGSVYLGGKPGGMAAYADGTGGTQPDSTDAAARFPNVPYAALIVTYNDLRAKEIYENYRFFDRDVLYFPAKDLIFFQADIHSNLLEQQRIAVFKALVERKKVTVITTMAACMNHLVPFEDWKDHIMEIDSGCELDVTELKSALVKLGYERTGQVEGPGQFAIRGGIIDIYPLTEENPVRIELWGEEVDSIRSFDVESQRSIENLESVRIYPAAELIPDDAQRQTALERLKKEAAKAEKVFRDSGKTEEAARIRGLLQDCKDQMEEFAEPLSMESFIDYFVPQKTTLLDYFDVNTTLLFLDEPNRMLEAAQAVETEFRESMKHRLEKGYVLPGQTNLLFSCNETAAALCRGNAVGLCTLENARAPWTISGKYGLTVRSVNSYNNSFEYLVQDLRRWKREGYRVILLAASRTRGNRLAGDLLEEGLTSFYTEDAGREVQPG